MSQIQIQKLKASQILRLSKYEWCIGNLAKSWNRQQRCAMGAILGHLGWNGDQSIFINEQSVLLTTDHTQDHLWKPALEYTAKLKELGLMGPGKTFSTVYQDLERYNDDGHNYEQCADWLEKEYGL